MANLMKQALFSLLLCCFTAAAHAFQVNKTAAQTDPIPSIFDALMRDDYLPMTIETDYRQLKKKRKSGDDYQPARLTYTNNKGEKHELNIQVKPRGKMRRQVCDFPPLKIRFSEEDLAARGLKSFETLKIVTLCKNSKLFEQYTLREYLAYRLLSILTDRSFRVQLAKINFVDTNGKDTQMESFAILIEHPDEMAQRLGGKVLPNNIFSDRLLNTDAFEFFCVFQYMIGNTDWHPFSGHNMVLYSQLDTVMPVPIPYDFDYAGIVNAPYAVPHELIDIHDVSERFYQGYCRKEEQLKQTLELFIKKKSEILNYCQQFPYFDDTSRKYVMKYIQSFFEIIENKGRTKREILEHCNKWMKPH